MLKDQEICQLIKKDPTNQIIINLHDLLKGWKSSEYITTSMYSHL